MSIGWSETETKIILALAEVYFFFEERIKKSAAWMRRIGVMASTCLTQSRRRSKKKSSGNNYFNETITCGRCQKVFLPDRVINFDPKQNPLTLFWSRGRKFYCGTCKRVQHWHQACLSDGTFLFPPVVVCGPTYYYTQEKIDEFLSAHPEADEVQYIEST